MNIRRLRAPIGAGLVAGALLSMTACGTTSANQAAPLMPATAEATRTEAARDEAASTEAARDEAAKDEAAKDEAAGTGAPSAEAAPPAESSRAPRSRSSVSPRQTTTPSPSPKSQAQPAALFSSGDQGERVRELQHRLSQLDWFSGSITGSYAAATADAVAGFQRKRAIRPTGEVDDLTWDTLVAMTREPTQSELHNVLPPGPAILKVGADSDRVRELQARLQQAGWHLGPITGRYSSATVSSVKGFQAKRQIPVTGEVDQRTWDRLTAMTRTPTKDEMSLAKPKPEPTAADLDPRCLTGRVLCISKSSNKLVWVIDGKEQLRVDVRFGSEELPTREGAFAVGWKSRNHVSTIYHTPMPFAMFFSGGQAVHYSPDFAARGYAGASHGCVNVRDRQAVQRLFDNVDVGDTVIVHR